jgi:hypothetical protein
MPARLFFTRLPYQTVLNAFATDPVEAGNLIRSSRRDKKRPIKKNPPPNHLAITPQF